MKYGFALGCPGLPVAAGHGQLIQVGEQRQRAAVQRFEFWEFGHL
jgi:hypothetical protein